MIAAAYTLEHLPLTSHALETGVLSVDKVVELTRFAVPATEIDEAPGVYKDIHQVMAAQSDLVDVVARFDPKIVKMADAGEKPED
mgnify:CR=1 FL=1